MAAAMGGGENLPKKEDAYWPQLLSPEDREYYWWRCNEMMCSNPTPELMKVQLKVLRDKSKIALEKQFATHTIPPASQEKYRYSLDLIFQDNTISLTSINVKSIQVCFLFTKLLIQIGKVDDTFPVYGGDTITTFYREADALGDKFFIYSKALTLISEDKNFNEFVTRKEGIKNFPICVILGELTMEELIESWAKEVYLCGVVFDMAWADGQHYSPLEFLHHDLLHMSNRELAYPTQEQLENLLLFTQYLQYSSNVSEKIKKTCYLMLFILSHESYEEYKLDEQITTSLTPTKKQFESEEVEPGWELYRYTNKHDLGGLLEWLTEEDLSNFTDDRIINTLLDAGNVLTQTWNDFFATKKATFKIPNIVNKRNNLRERLRINVENWNRSYLNKKGGRRTIRKTKSNIKHKKSKKHCSRRKMRS